MSRAGHFRPHSARYYYYYHTLHTLPNKGTSVREDVYFLQGHQSSFQLERRLLL